MSKNVETIEINAFEDYGSCLGDSINKRSNDRVSPKGYVEVFEERDDGSKKLLGKHNLVLYLGREWLAQRIMNKRNIEVDTNQDEFICWFGLGDGGVIPGDPFNPTPPVITDNMLASHIMITATDSSAADYHVASPTYPEEGYYKIPLDTVAFEIDPQNDDAYLIIKITITVGAEYANGKQLSEAGLFTAASDAGGYVGMFNIFSRVTFPSIVKTSDRRLIFNWFLYV